MRCDSDNRFGQLAGTRAWVSWVNFFSHLQVLSNLSDGFVIRKKGVKKKAERSLTSNPVPVSVESAGEEMNYFFYSISSHHLSYTRVRYNTHVALYMFFVS